MTTSPCLYPTKVGRMTQFLSQDGPWGQKILQRPCLQTTVQAEHGGVVAPQSKLLPMGIVRTSFQPLVVQDHNWRYPGEGRVFQWTGGQLLKGLNEGGRVNTLNAPFNKYAAIHNLGVVMIIKWNVYDHCCKIDEARIAWMQQYCTTTEPFEFWFIWAL